MNTLIVQKYLKMRELLLFTITKHHQNKNNNYEKNKILPTDKHKEKGKTHKNA